VLVGSADGTAVGMKVGEMVVATHAV